MTLEELITYLRILKKRWWVIAFLMAATVGAVLSVSYTAEPKYRASLSFQVTGTPPGTVSLYGDYRQPMEREEIGYTRNNYLQVLRSYGVAWETVKTLKLSMAPEDLMEKAVVEEVKDSDVIKLSIVADDAQLAADLTNTVMDTALKLYGQLRARSLTDAREFIAQRLAESQEELTAAREALTQFKIENKISSADALIESQLTLIRALTLDRDAALAQGNTDQVRSYDQIIAQRQLELQNLFELSTEYDALKETFQQAQTLFKYLLDKETEARLKENEVLHLSFIQILGSARPPSHPLSPIDMKVLALGAAVSLILGVGSVFLWEFLETASREIAGREEAAVSGAPDELPGEEQISQPEGAFISGAGS